MRNGDSVRRRSVEKSRRSSIKKVRVAQKEKQKAEREEKQSVEHMRIKKEWRTLSIRVRKENIAIKLNMARA